MTAASASHSGTVSTWGDRLGLGETVPVAVGPGVGEAAGGVVATATGAGTSTRAGTRNAPPKPSAAASSTSSSTPAIVRHRLRRGALVATSAASAGASPTSTAAGGSAASGSAAAGVRGRFRGRFASWPPTPPRPRGWRHWSRPWSSPAQPAPRTRRRAPSALLRADLTPRSGVPASSVTGSGWTSAHSGGMVGGVPSGGAEDAVGSAGSWDTWPSHRTVRCGEVAMLPYPRGPMGPWGAGPSRHSRG